MAWSALGISLCAISLPSARAGEDPPGALPSLRHHDEERAESTATVDEQGNSKDDVKLTAQIRRAIVKNQHLSIAAHNVKIIARSGVVTLKGQVRSTAERTLVAEKASRFAGAEHVRNELDVALPK